MSLRIELSGDRRAYRPGDKIHGTVAWELDCCPKDVELRLFWKTAGRGDRDVGVIDQHTFAVDDKKARADFGFVAPDGPYSFAGNLVQLSWGLELIVDDGKIQLVEPITLSATGEVVTLQAVEDPEQSKS